MKNMRVVALGVLLALRIMAGNAADVARAIRENSFDRDECYRVRDLTLQKEDVRIYLTEGYLIFSKPVAGRRIAAVFSSDVDGGDGEVMLLPPDRAERRSLAGYTDSPNLNEHIKHGVFLFTGDDYEQLKEQMARTPGNKKAPEMGPLLDEQWSPTLRNLGTSYQNRLTLDLVGGPAWKPGLFAALMNGKRLGNFDLIYDPDSPEQILMGQIMTRENRVYFDTWASFPSKSARQNPRSYGRELELRDYRIEVTINPDFSMDVVSRVKVKAVSGDAAAAPFDIAVQMA